MDAFVQDAVVGDHVRGVTGHEEALQRRMSGSKPFSQFPTVDGRHHHIGDQQVDLALMSSGKRQSHFRRVGHEHRIAKALENALPQLEIWG